MSDNVALDDQLDLSWLEFVDLDQFHLPDWGCTDYAAFLSHQQPVVEGSPIQGMQQPVIENPIQRMHADSPDLNGVHHANNRHIHAARIDTREATFTKSNSSEPHEWTYNAPCQAMPELPAIEEQNAGNAPLDTNTPAGIKGKRVDDKLFCDHPGCNHKSTFPRRYELARHKAQKHSSERKFACPVSGCFRGADPPKFSRSDKFRDHVEKVHNLDSRASCPGPECMKSLPLLLLPAHMFRCSAAKKSPAALEIPKAVARICFRCPLWKCKKVVRTDLFLSHMHEHEISEFDTPDMLSVLKVKNLVFVKQPGSSGSLAASGDFLASPGGAFAVRIACPICRELSDSPSGFGEHLLREHLVRPGKEGHYDALVSSFWIFDRSRKSWIWPWHPGKNRFDERCLACGEQIKSGYTYSNHHLSLLRDGSDLLSYREQILSLFPDFYTHSVFDNVA